MADLTGVVALWTAACRDTAGREVEVGVTVDGEGIVLLTPDGGHLSFGGSGTVDLVSAIRAAEWMLAGRGCGDPG
jgi:hypothetical protein